MQIFAKRTKKKTTGNVGPRTVHKSDPVVEELLKKDPSEWNAKERRMVKRYKERKTSKTNEVEAPVNNQAPRAEEKTSKEEINVLAQKNSEEDDSSISDDQDQHNEKVANIDEKSDDDSSSTRDKSRDDKIVGGDKETGMVPEAIMPVTQEKTMDNTSAIENANQTKGSDESEKVPKDHEIWGVLEKLNSKQKRTLSRKLDRLGNAVLEQVEEEANSILDKTMPIDVETLKRNQMEATSTDQSNSKQENDGPKKKRKKTADWSHLPAEERLRREEQRRKQQEAAERRARGEDIKPGHKRPLNSARRRANRRKPKWAPKTPSGAPDISDYKREHHTSGFHHRKTRGTTA